MSDSISRLLATRRWCYAVPPCQDFKKLGGYIPSVIIENETGHFPMAGRDGGAPWIWGPTMVEAQAAADDMNRKMGLLPDAVSEIEASSFHPH